MHAACEQTDLDTRQCTEPARLPGCPAARLPGCLAARLPDCPTARLPGCPAARLPGCPTARLPGCPTARLPGCPAARHSPKKFNQERDEAPKTYSALVALSNKAQKATLNS